MKFGKHLNKEKVPEWTDAYVDYNGLKRTLQAIVNQARQGPNPSTAASRNRASLSGDLENQVIDVHTVEQENFRKLYNTKLLVSRRDTHRHEKETVFFEKLDNELNKTNNFYKDKVEEVTREANLLEKQIDALVALRIRVTNPDFDGNNPEIDVETSDRSQPGPSSSTEDSRCKAQQHSGDICEIPPSKICVSSIDGGENETSVLEVLDRVKISNTSDGPMSTIKRVFKEPKEKDLSYNKVELKAAQGRLKAAFIEFYQMLCRLKHYSYMNLLAFSKILKKYDKVTSRSVTRSYMRIVDNSFIGNSDEVTNLMEWVEVVFIKNFLNSNRREGMRLLKPKQKKDKHRVTFLSGFFSGCSVALLVAVILLIEDRRLIQKKTATLYMNTIFPLYSFYIYIVLHMMVYAANTYFWKRYKINYPFIFEFKQGTELGSRDVFLLSNGLAVIALATFLVHLHIKMDSETQHYETYVELLPLGLVIVIVGIIFCPFNIIYRSSRMFLVMCTFRLICAPLYKVKLPDFFLADQFTSQIQALRSFEYYICFYGNGKLSKKLIRCDNLDLYNVFYFIVAVIPYWFRFLQCVRRLFEEKDSYHAYNGLKYLWTIIAVVIRTTFELKKNITWKVLALASSLIATVANTYWDIAIDWGLLQRKSKNPFLRDKLSVSHRSVYFGAMILDILLRFAWLQLVLTLNVHSLQGKSVSTIFSCLEIVRRGIWNFFRLENEHFNNVGKYRAFKSVPLPFTYYDDENEDEEIDKDD
ncbi:Phosphate transporter PHO1 homolog 10 [Striga hermonthica]|uniref:Phosphate transporter PHO1 homolog 10 n=1 Tax=Striga hermonthica TaxID=68872 RepID=A0A9N7N7X2_STRHE|nr:Phosphate transporter PHO1 homolog 10 [Striga hermonthica]